MSFASVWRNLVEPLPRYEALSGVLQNGTAPIIIDDPPFFDLVQGSKAAEASIVVVQATIADARRLSRGVGITHGRAQLRGFEVNHTCSGRAWQCITRRAISLRHLPLERASPLRPPKLAAGCQTRCLNV
jgi:hypothetical protein